MKIKSFKMKSQKILKLQIDLPDCPKGRLFKEDVNGDFFHALSDDEVINRRFKPYSFTKEEVADNPKWFVRIDTYPEHAKAQKIYSDDQLDALGDYFNFLEQDNIELREEVADSKELGRCLTPFDAFFKMMDIDEDKIKKEAEQINEDSNE